MLYVGLNRSVALLLQVALPVALFANAPVSLELKGGTNADMAPQIDFITEIFRPNLLKFGGDFNFNIVKRGLVKPKYEYIVQLTFVFGYIFQILSKRWRILSL